MFYPTKAEFTQLAQNYNLIPVWREFVADLDTPISLCLKLGTEHVAYFLESVEGGENLARYSFIGIRPFLTYCHQGKQGLLQLDGHETVIHEQPIAGLERIMSTFKAPRIPGIPDFFGGAVGYFGYDLIRYLEDLPNLAADELQLPIAHFVVTDLVLIFDQVQHKVKIVANVRPGADCTAAYEQAQIEIDGIIKLLQAKKPAYLQPGNQTLGRDMRSNFTPEQFIQTVSKIQEYIAAGDVFQVVLSQRFQATLMGEPFEIYRTLRTINPAPYLFYLNFGSTVILGSSPEMLVRVEDGKVTTRPIAGTRPRGKNPQEDRDLATELLADAKEKAEHLMLVDLGRNDLGRVCQPGSIRVTEFMGIEAYSHVMHLVSNVEGYLQRGKTGFDALKACFPAGTLSGAPKIRAMEIIEELEPSRRGIYGGVIGYFGFNGNVDTCIAIRTIVVHQGQVYIQAGGGIVADSDPEQEFQESMNKAKALLQTLQGKKEAAS